MKQTKKVAILKGLSFFTLTVLMLCATLYSALSAPAMPHPVYGQVEIFDEIMPFYNVKLDVCDVRQSTLTNCVVVPCVKKELCEFNTDSTGSFVFEMANINPNYRTGDLIRLDVCDGNSNCAVIVPLGEDSTNINFKVGSTVVPADITPAETIKTEKTVYVPDPKTATELEKIKLKIADVDTNLERLKAGSGLKWWHAFMLMILAVIAAFGGSKGYKMLKTTIQKNNKKAYGR